MYPQRTSRHPFVGFDGNPASYDFAAGDQPTLGIGQELIGLGKGRRHGS